MKRRQTSTKPKAQAKLKQKPITNKIVESESSEEEKEVPKLPRAPRKVPAKKNAPEIKDKSPVPKIQGKWLSTWATKKEEIKSKARKLNSDDEIVVESVEEVKKPVNKKAGKSVEPKKNVAKEPVRSNSKKQKAAIVMEDVESEPKKVIVRKSKAQPPSKPEKKSPARKVVAKTPKIEHSEDEKMQEE